MIILEILNPVFGLAINVVIQIFICRYLRRVGLLKSVYIGFFAGFLMMIILDAPVLLPNLITYSLLSYCYFNFINLGETARRIRILRELYDSKNGLSLEELLQRYNAEEILERRINRMLNSSQVVLKEGRYYIGSPMLLLIAKAITTMKQAILGKRSEFD